MRFTTRQTLKHCLIAVAATLAGLLGMGGMAQAAPSAAPKIVTQPSDPNTQAASTFTYTVGDGETSVVSPLRYYCRVYNADAAPPAATTGWAACGLSTDAQPVTKSYTQANGNWTFQVAVREGTNFSTQGPIETVTWTQDQPAPTKAPDITVQPDDPSDLASNTFQYTAGTGEVNTVDRFQCRLDSSEESGWVACNLGSRSYSPGNGEHTFQVRAGNGGGYGPIETVTWTVDVPNPSPSVKLEDVATDSWNGAVANAQARVASIGDVNGDGRDDLAFVSKESSGDNIADVVFGKSGGVGDRTLGSQSVGEGFRIVAPPGGMLGGLYWVKGIGDQNDDGVDDMVVEYPVPLFPGFVGSFALAVIYGDVDVTGLPACTTGSARCLNLDSLTADQGYVLDTESPYLGNSGVSISYDTGDFDGDGTDDLLFAGGKNTGWYAVVKGGVERTGTVALSSLPDTERLTLISSSGAGGGISDLGDLDGDGRDDVFLMDDSSGTHAVVYGRSFGGDEFDITAMGSDDGFTVYGSAVASAWVSSVGDLNGDGITDLAAPTYNALTGAANEAFVGFYYTPKRGSGDSVVLGEDMDPATGYLVGNGGPNTGLGKSLVQNIGDINNDGTPDSIVSAEYTPVDGQATVGAAYVLFGQNPKPASTLGVGPTLTPDLGVGLLGNNAGDNVGEPVNIGGSTASLGDTDGDGLTDFAIGAPLADPNGVANAGTVYIVPGKNLINQVKTGKAAGVANSSAVLNAGLSTNNRDSQVWFEYGTSDEYGQSTDPESFEGSNTGDAASAAVSGLEKNTEYHYRAVAKNALGLVRYGDDRTFTTTNVDDKPIETCDLDPTGPGCVDYCKANPTAKGCDGYDWCGNNPGKCSTGTSKARLALISTTKKITLKRGKKASHSVAVVNTGGKAASGVKVCVKAPKKLVKVKKCVKVGKLASGKTRVVKVKVKAKRKKGKAVLKLTASGNKLSAKKAKAKVVVR